MKHSITESAKAELNNHYSYVTEGIIMRSRVQWYEKGEKNNKYFLNLEKRNKMRSSVRKLIVNGTVVLNPEKVLSEVRAYYTNLYSRRSLHTEKDCSEYLANLNCPILTEDERRACDGMLSQGEIYNSLKDLPANKTPGNDGLSKEFYLPFYDLLGKDLQECYKHSFEKGKLAPSQYQAVIVLIEKRGKDKRYIRNWRPISLLNVDTKILSKALASRLKKVIAQLISRDQTAYVPKRNICESIRLTSDLFEYADSHPISAYMVTADIEKAFDSVDHNFLFATLKKFGLGPEFISWVRVLIKKLESCIMNNGKTTEYFLCLEEQDKEILCRLFYSSLPWKCYLFWCVLTVKLRA